MNPNAGILAGGKVCSVYCIVYRIFNLNFASSKTILSVREKSTINCCPAPVRLSGACIGIHKETLYLLQIRKAKRCPGSARREERGANATLSAKAILVW